MMSVSVMGFYASDETSSTSKYLNEAHLNKVCVKFLKMKELKIGQFTLLQKTNHMLNSCK